MLTLLLLLLLATALALAAVTYLRFERLGRRALVPLLLRATAWFALGLLLVNVGCPRSPAARRPLVLLDASLSMAASGGHWADALALARRLGDVRRFGDDRSVVDTLPDRGRSLLGPALAAASAGDRPVIVITDGEIDDARDIAPDLLARATIRVLPRAPGHDLAVTALDGPSHVTRGDTLWLDVEIADLNGAAGDSATLEVTAGDRRLVHRAVAVGGGTRLTLAVPTTALAAGDQLLHVALVGARDAEPLTDVRAHLVTVTATPGVVILAAPGDWDSRFLFRTIRDVAQLPVRGYVRIEADRWRSMHDLEVVGTEEVRRAARQADLLVLKGGTSAFAAGSAARGLWLWPSGEGGETPIDGDWYLAATTASPLAGAFLGQPLDSFPPVVRISPVEATIDDWVALTAQEGRRGAERPVVLGRDDGRHRRVRVAADGLWRWAFRGGSSEQVYRAWVAATTSWLLGGADSARGAARPARAVVQRGRPVVFQWIAGGTPRDLSPAWSATGASRSDTLRFDGAGRAVAWLPVGEYRYRLGDGGAGTVVVEPYSDEWVRRPPTVVAHAGRMSATAGRSAARDWIWLFGVAIAALAGEWLARRRLGLR